MSPIRAANPNRVVQDYLQVNGGAERLVIMLASGLGFDLGVSGIYPGFSGSGDLKGLAPHLPGKLLECLPRIPRALIAFSRGMLLPAEPDCVIYSGIYAPLAVCQQTRGKRILYCHTPPRFAFDQEVEYLRRVPRLARPALRACIHRYRDAYLKSVRAMDVVVTPSLHVQARLEAQTGVRAEVIYPPVDVECFRFIDQQDYYLSVGRLEPHKRIERIVRAFLLMPDKQLIVAAGGSQLHALQALAAGAANIRFVGWQDEKGLATLTGQAIAVLYVSRDEDFGMSAVESMAAGKPVIGVAEGGLRESIVDGQTGILLPPDPSAEAIAAAVGRLPASVALGMRAACEFRAQAFSRQRFLTAFENLLSR